MAMNKNRIYSALGCGVLLALTAGGAQAAHMAAGAHNPTFDLTTYYGEHAARCSGTGVTDPRDEQKTFILKPGEIEIRGHNFWYSKLKSATKGTSRSMAFYSVNASSNTTLVFESDKLVSAVTKDVIPDAHGQPMNVQTDCTFE